MMLILYREKRKEEGNTANDITHNFWHYHLIMGIF
jgi:hypothetical protein